MKTSQVLKPTTKTYSISSCTCHLAIIITFTHLLTGTHKSKSTFMVSKCLQLMPTLTCVTSGELLPVAPWAARTMPALFAVNERVLISGTWEYGFFSMVAVGAFNVGSISLEHDKVHLSDNSVCSRELFVLPRSWKPTSRVLLRWVAGPRRLWV